MSWEGSPLIQKNYAAREAARHFDCVTTSRQ